MNGTETATAAVRLETTPDDPARLERIEAQLDALLAWTARRDAELDLVRDVAADLGVLAGPIVATTTDRVAELEARGYLGFARSSARVVDRIVTSFDEDDVEALGDNVVLMLETLRDLTQPEVLGLLRRTAGAVGDGHDVPSGPPPSSLALLRELRDPAVRRGLARVLDLVRTVGADAPQTSHPPRPHEPTTPSG